VRAVTDRAAREVGEETGWLLIERTTDEDEDNSTVSVKAWICWDLDDSSLEELVQWTHLRWSIDGFTETSNNISEAMNFKDGVGMDSTAILRLSC
jgi:hypothetical protein